MHMTKRVQAILRSPDVLALPPEEKRSVKQRVEAYFRNGDGLEELARTRIRGIASVAGVALSPDTIAAHAHEVIDAFAWAMQVFNGDAMKVALTDLNIGVTGHRSAAWDYELSHAASKCVTQEGATLRVVTNDKGIRSAAEQVGGFGRVMILTEHQADLAS